MALADLLGGRRLLIVSNRLPYTVRLTKDGFELAPSTGGLATGMRPLLEKGYARWIGWPGVSLEAAGDRAEAISQALRQRGMIPVWLTAEEVEGFYEGFCNNTIWPLFHYFPERAVYDERYWGYYVAANRKFADAVAQHAVAGDIVWVHDYHLMLAPSMVRERLGDDAPIGFFLHIPFPNFEVFRQLPWRAEILRGLLGADLVGFHTYDYVSYFLESVTRILGLRHELGEIDYGGRVVRVDVFPMGIDFAGVRSAALSEAVTEKVRELRARLGNVKVVFSIDRLDYTKGLLHRLRAFKRFLEKYPEFRGKVSYVFVVSPSRERVEEYARLRREINELVGEINGQFSTLDWTPVIYIRRYIDQEELLALYRLSDVALIAPLRDGMNLVAKEFIAANVDRKGFLIVSEGAGAASELVEAIVVNPNDEEGMADALKRALTMSESERVSRLSSLESRVSSYDVNAWASDFVDALLSQKERQLERSRLLTAMRLGGTVLAMIASAFEASSRRILFLDYDGTLMPFSSAPWLATPDEDLLGLLDQLSRRPNTRVVIVTSRSRASIESLLGGVGVDIAAENGAWVRVDGKWQLAIATKDVSWKQEVIRIFSTYTKRTPGSFIEEKDFSVTWHYRSAPEGLGEERASELVEVLGRFAAVHPDLAVVRLPKAVEVRLAELSKARAAQYWLSRDKYDFVLAAGDSEDDEALFASLPQDAVTIKVGQPPTRARYVVLSPRELREALRTIAGLRGS